MNIQQVIEVTDRLLLEHRERALSDLEREILRETLKDSEYEKVAENTRYALSYVRTIGAKLWLDLSEILDTEINKRNFKVVIEKLDIERLYQDSKDYSDSATYSDSDLTLQNTNTFKSATFQDVTFNMCPNVQEPAKSTTEPKKIPFKKNIEIVPECFNCYGREQELKILQEWILEERDRIIAILGFPGIGKTTLSLKLAELMKPHFDIIVYRSLDSNPALHVLLADISEALGCKIDNSYVIDKHLTRLQRAFYSQRCLLIFDDFHHLFAPNELSGTYIKKREKYQRLFKILATTSHQSCLLLCSREKPEEIVQWEGDCSPIRSLELQGSKETAIALFKEKKLRDEPNWETLINDWQGHPLQLQEIAILIQEVFGGDVNQFREYSRHFLGTNLKGKIAQHLDRLSDWERDVILAFDDKNDSLAIGKLMQKSGQIPSEFFNVVQSLQRRFCLETEEKERIKHFSLTPLLQKYLISNPLE